MLTQQEIQEVFDSVKFPSTEFKIDGLMSLFWGEPQAGYVRTPVTVSHKTLDTYTNEPTVIAAEGYLPKWTVESKASLTKFMLSMILKWVTHEARENFLVNGERVFDPHKEKRVSQEILLEKAA